MFSNIEINNNIKIEELNDNKIWIHGNNKENIEFTIFLITISTEQLKYSLESINKMDLNIPFIVNIIKNISPTNKAYNEMRLRCKTKYFIQNDEDMELYPNCLSIIKNLIKEKDKNIFLYTFKLIDTILGVGNPPIIDCLKVYNNNIMKDYPTINNGNITVSSVDSLWHKPLIENNFTIKNTNIIIGYHGNHRSNFDLLLRYCKILSSLINPNIKTNSSHICKILKPLFIDIDQNINILLKKILFLIKDKKKIDYNILNNCIKKLNSYVDNNRLKLYNIKNRYNIDNINENNLINCTMNEIKKINSNLLMGLLSIICISTNSYEYSFDKYPYTIYNYFI